MSERLKPSSKEPSAWLTVTRWLLMLNLLFAVTDWFILRRWASITYNGQPVTPEMPLLAIYGHFSFAMAIGNHEVWRFITYQFVHGNIEHLIVNMMALLLAGPIVEERLGKLRFLGFYLLCGIAGPIAHLVLGHFGLLSVQPFTPLIGASASIYGVLVAAAILAPNEIVEIAFPPIDLKLRTLAIILIALSFAAVLYRLDNAGGHAAHLGGVVMGWLLIRGVKRQPKSTP